MRERRLTKHAFCLLDGDRHGDPLATAGAVDGGSVDAVVGEPLVYNVYGFWVRRDERSNLLLGEMLAVAMMGGVRDLVKRCDELVELVLLEAHPHDLQECARVSITNLVALQLH